MATKATALLTLDQIKAHLGPIVGAGQDASLSILGDGISERIESYTGRFFVSRSVTETRDGNGKNHIDLRHYPIVSVETLKIRYSLLDEWTALTVATETVLDKYRGRLYLNSLYYPVGPLAVEAAYTAGWGAQGSTDLPQDVVHAALDYAKFVYQRWSAGALMASSMTIGPNTISVVPDIPPDIKRTLDAYKKVRAVFAR